MLTLQEIVLPEPLVVSESSMTVTGSLTISFNKPIFTPDKYKDLETNLKRPNFDDEFHKVISMTVSSAYFDDDAPETQIKNFKLSSFDSTGFTLEIAFEMPAYISQSLTE